MSDVEQPKKTEIVVEDQTETRNVPVFSQLALVAGILLLVFGGGYLPRFFDRAGSTPEQPAVIAAATDPTESAEILSDPFSEVAIVGSSAFVWDSTTKRVLWQKAPDMQLPLASVTKLMTALLAYELVAADTEIVVSQAAINQDGTSGLAAGESFSIQSLSDILLLSSSNDGAYAIAESVGSLLDPTDGTAAFVAAMNVRAEELDLTQTYFRNPTGLDIQEDEAGAYGSARNVAFLLDYIVTKAPSILEGTTNTKSTLYTTTGLPHTVYNTNQRVAAIPGLIGSKTGYTELAGGNLAIAFDAAVNRPVVIVVLGSTRSARFSDVERLVDATRSALQ